MQLIRLYQHLVPRAAAWSLTVETTLRRFFEGLAGLPGDVRTFVDAVYLDLWPSSTRELAAWEKQFALGSGGSVADRRGKVAAAWSIQGRLSPDYLQRAIHAAGFTTVFVHEWWTADDESPRPARDPRDHTEPPLVGFYQCEGSTPWQCFERGAGDAIGPHCDDTLANDPGYLVNLDLTRRAPPPIPDATSHHRAFVYLAGETFPDAAEVPSSRLAELKALVLRLKPAHLWVVLIVDAIDEGEGFGVAPFGGAPEGA